MWSISARNITQAGQDATNRSKTSPKIIVVALAEVLRTPNKGNQYQIEVGQNTPPSKPWLSSLTLSLVRLESLTYFLAGIIVLLEPFPALLRVLSPTPAPHHLEDPVIHVHQGAFARRITVIHGQPLICWFKRWIIAPAVRLPELSPRWRRKDARGGHK